MKNQVTARFNEQSREPSDSKWRKAGGFILFLLAAFPFPGWW